MTDTPPEDHDKVSHWDRPNPPHDWRWVVGGIGRTLITLGLLMFGFVAYQLWGTGIQTAQAQRELSADFDKLVSGAGATTTTVGSSLPSTTTTTSTVPATSSTTIPAGSIVPSTTTTTTLPGLAAAKPIPAEGEAIARLEIPRISLNRIVVEGATTEDLAKGPGHFPETPLPGQLGNAAVAGHRTTHLHPFYDIDKLQPGDEIIVTTLNGRYVYHVTGTEVVSPEDYAAVIPTTDPTKATLTLVSCTPRYSSTNRIIVHAELVASESDPLTVPGASASAGQNSPPQTLPTEGTDNAATTIATVAATTVTSDTIAGTVSATVSSATSPPTSTTIPPVTGGATGSGTRSPDAFADGWFSDTSAIPQSLIWGLLGGAIAYGILWLSRRVRRYWVGVLAGFAPFIFVLYFFYENVNRLLPPNL